MVPSSLINVRMLNTESTLEYNSYCEVNADSKKANGFATTAATSPIDYIYIDACFNVNFNWPFGSEGRYSDGYYNNSDFIGIEGICTVSVPLMSVVDATNESNHICKNEGYTDWYSSLSTYDSV